MDSNHTISAHEHCLNGLNQSVRFQADTMQHIDAAIAADENYCMPKLAKAWMLHGAGDARFAGQVSELAEQCEALLPASVSIESELLAGLRHVSDGRKREGSLILEALLEQHPSDAFLHVLAQEEIFWLGDSQWMRNIAEKAAPHWKQADTNYGPLLSLRAFANEEAGFFDAAERYGMEAVEIDSSNVWGAHAVAHVLLMKGEIQRGTDWLERLSPNWQDANQMQHHLWWHYCLFLLETGDYERTVELLDTRIRNPDSELVKASPAATIDINNYSSLLMRLELYGVDVSDRWQTLAAICSKRTDNHASVFSNIHDVMVLAGNGNHDQATALLDNMTGQYADPTFGGSLAKAYRDVGIPVCKAMLAHRANDYGKVLRELGGVRHKLHLMGASHAQRDVFFHLLVHAAAKEGREDLQREYMQDIENLGFCDVPSRAAYQGIRN